MKKIVLIILFITCKAAIAQSLVTNDTAHNFTDAAGKRQGKWIILNNMIHKPDYVDLEPRFEAEQCRKIANCHL